MGSIVVIGMKERLAMTGRRAAAAMIDLIIFLLVAYMLAAICGNCSLIDFVTQRTALWLTLLLNIAYYIYFEGVAGATIGKMIMELKVVKIDGRACDIRAAVIRTAARLIDMLPCVYLAGAVLILCCQDSRRLGDRLAGTTVIRKINRMQ